MQALAVARKEIGELGSLNLTRSSEALQATDEIAEALGIDTSSDDWWEWPGDKHAKILGRISVLRGLKASPKLP